MKESDVLLTDKETEIIIGEELKLLYSGHVLEYQDIAKAQAKKYFNLMEQFRWGFTSRFDMPWETYQELKKILEV